MRKIVFFFFMMQLAFLKAVYADIPIGAQIGIFLPTGYYQDYFKNGYSIFFETTVEDFWIRNLNLKPEMGIIFGNFKTQSDATYQIISLGAAVEYPLKLSESFYFSPEAGAGTYLLKINPGETFYNLYSRVGTGFQYHFAQSWKASLAGDFLYFNDPEQSITGWRISAGLTYHFGNSKNSGRVEISQIKINSVFASAYGTYFKKSAGEIELKNTSGESVQNISLSVFIASYMDAPSVSRFKPSLLRDSQSIKIPLEFYFNKNIQSLDTDLDTTAVIEVQYTLGGKQQTVRQNKRLKIYSKNAIAWEDLNRAGAFISMQDSLIAHFARQAVAISGASQKLPENWSNVIKLTESLRFYPVSYVKEPKNSYQNFLNSDAKIDLLQYPRETLVSKTGACSDLTVLLAALLENISIPTALVATDTHIFLMAELKGIESQFLIQYMGKNWLPIETTEIQNGFFAAWQKGYENYRNAKNKKIKTIIEAVSEYPPIVIDKPAEIFFNSKSLELEQNFKKEQEKVLRFLNKE